MDTYRTDEEQVEALKRWWEANGKLVILAGIFFVAVVVGGRVWMDFKETAMAKASAEYDLMLDEMLNEKVDDALRRGSMLMEQHADAPYAAMAALAMAKMEVEKGDLNSARLRLNWVLEHKTLDNLDHVARTRLVRILIEEGKLDEALTQASVADMGTFSAEYSMLRGDIYRAQGKKDMAISAYKMAMDSAEVSPQTKSVLKLKLADLGEANS